MERFVETPNLPQRRVKVCALSGDERHRYAADALRALGIACIPTEACARLPRPVAYHADMQLLHLGGRHFALEDSCRALREGLLSRGATVDCLEQADDRYPGDCVLNALILGGRFYCAEQPPAGWKRALGANLRFVKQGYTRCSCAVVAKNAVITADRGIGTKLRADGVDCLVIPPGEITLEGYDCGFIGGCCGLVDRGVLAFTGDISRLSYGGMIADFLQKQGVRAVALRSGIPEDIGGILPLTE